MPLPGRPRYASQTTPHASLVKMVEEILRPEPPESSGGTVSPTGTRQPREGRRRVDQGRLKVRVETTPAPKSGSTAAAEPEPALVVETPAASRYAHISVTAVVDRLLLTMLDMGASDLHLSTDCPPRVRVHGRMTLLPGAESRSEHALLEQLFEITPERNRVEFETKNDTDFGHAIPGVSRFRANLFRDRRGPGAVFRAIPFEILTPDQLGLPPQVLELCNCRRDWCLVTGPTGSGKSTTLASLINHINENRTDHVITIEDPIEFVHENKKCLVNQREVHSHTDSSRTPWRACARTRHSPRRRDAGPGDDRHRRRDRGDGPPRLRNPPHDDRAVTIDRIIDQFPGRPAGPDPPDALDVLEGSHRPDALPKSEAVEWPPTRSSTPPPRWPT